MLGEREMCEGRGWCGVDLEGDGGCGVTSVELVCAGAHECYSSVVCMYRCVVCVHPLSVVGWGDSSL